MIFFEGWEVCDSRNGHHRALTDKRSTMNAAKIFLSLASFLRLTVITSADSSIDEINRMYDVCISGPEDDVWEGIRNPINRSMESYVETLTQNAIKSSPESMCQDLGLCPVPEKWMVPRSSLNELKSALKRTTFDVSMEESIKAIPKPSRSKPLNISMSVFIDSISAVDDTHNAFTVNLFLVQEWTLNQERCLNSYKAMAFKGVDVYKRFGNRSSFFSYMNSEYWLPDWPEDKFKLEPEHFRLFWMPDIYLSNARSQFAPYQSIDTRFLDIEITSFKNHAEMLDRGTFNECHFRYVWTFNAEVSCNMNFLKYPIDVQKCTIQFRSFAHPITDLVINLMHVQIDPGIQIGSQYVSISFQQNNIWPTSRRAIKNIPGLRSVARINIIFNRSLGSVFVGVMIPALLVVIISLAMFWIKIECLSDRIGSGITCLFTLLTQFTATRTAIATNSYITLMDWFMILCIAFVVIQTMQAIVVYIVYNREKKRIAELDHLAQEAKGKAVVKNSTKKDLECERRQSAAASERMNRKQEKWYMSGQNSSSCESIGAESRSLSEHMMTYKRNMKANSLSLRRRRRIIYPTTRFQSQRARIPTASHDDADTRSEHEIPVKSLEERLKELRDFLLEPTAQKGTPEYLPMKIDSISRIVIPFLFIFTMTAYGLLCASIDERT